jgi:hypothetical protein
MPGTQVTGGILHTAACTQVSRDEEPSAAVCPQHPELTDPAGSATEYTLSISLVTS